jgi:hypothetical protein
MPAYGWISVGSSRSSLIATPGCARTELSIRARVTGRRPAASVPSNHRPPSHRSAAHPVTAPYAGSTAAASTIRCSTVSVAAAGTYRP